MTQEIIETMRQYRKLGWSMIDGKAVFHGSEAISTDEIQSTYDGTLDVKPQGSIDNIVKMINGQILSCEVWSPLQFVIAASIGATVLPYAKMCWGIELNNIVVHLLGCSTSGKSTALKLHTGLGVNVYSVDKGYWITNMLSLGKIIRAIGYNMGFPISVDDLVRVGRMKFTSFSTVIMSSGEVSILRKYSENEGIRAWCIEIANEHWTESKEQAQAVVKCIRDNHGLVPPPVAEELLKNSDAWRDRWEQLDKGVQDKIEKDRILLSIAPRVADFVVLFTLSAELANKVLGIDLDTEMIFKFCYEHIVIANADEINS